MRRLFGVVLLCAGLGWGGLQAQHTLQPYHWSNDYLDYLRLSGVLDGLAWNERPLQREAVARALIRACKHAGRLDATTQLMLKILVHEYRGEIHYLYRTEGRSLPPLVRRWLGDESSEGNARPPREAGRSLLQIQLGTFGEFSLNDPEEGPARGSWHLHPEFSASLGNRLFAYNQFRVFNRADSLYIGKEFRNLFAFVEQGYLVAKSRWLHLRLGRDYLQLGPGRNGQLLISDNARPFDMYYVALGLPWLRFSFWGFALDNMTVPVNQRPQPVRRFLNGHRLSVTLKDRLSLGISEVALYGGVNQGWELSFVNPFGVYYGSNVNGPNVTGNVLYNIDWDWLPRPGVELYGEFLIDDIQVERKTPGDLEPNELGLLVGVQGANLFGQPGWMGRLEYTQVRNRTYNVQNRDWEKYVHRNRVIGYWGGNNLETWRLDVWQWIRGDLRGGLFWQVFRQGEGSVLGEFNTDFLNASVEEGYHEPFPFGVVERTTRLGGNLFWRPGPSANLTLAVNRVWIQNRNHIEGVRRSGWEFQLKTWLSWEWVQELAAAWP